MKGAFANEKVPAAMVDKLKQALVWANDMVKKTGTAAGTSHFTIADLAFLTTFTSIEALKFIDLSPYGALNAWFEKVKHFVPNYDEANGKGAREYGQFMGEKVRANVLQ